MRGKILFASAVVLVLVLGTTGVAGLPEGNETEAGTIDSDEDGLSNERERELGTDPWLPDTDHDGVKDGKEVELGLDPLSVDTDDDGVNDWHEIRGYTPTPEQNTTTGIETESEDDSPDGIFLPLVLGLGISGSLLVTGAILSRKRKN